MRGIVDIEVGREGGFEAEVADGCGLECEELLFEWVAGHGVRVAGAGCEREGADGTAEFGLGIRILD